MKTFLCYLPILVLLLTLRNGFGAVDFSEPDSGSFVADFEGTVNASTLVCNISNNGQQVSTQWGWMRRGSVDLISISEGSDLFLISGPPDPTDTRFSLRNMLTILNLTAELDGATVFCGTGLQQQQGNFRLRLYRPPNLRDTFLVRIKENTRNVPVDLGQEPAAFPEPMSNSFTWYKDGQPLVGRTLTYSSVTFNTIRQEDAGNYTVFASNFVLEGDTEQIGNDTGSFYLDVIFGPIFDGGNPPNQPTQRYALLNGTLSLLCGSNLRSNPSANITWIAPDGTTIMDNDRYDLDNGPENVRLDFVRTILNDTGQWRCDVTVISDRYFVSGQRLVVEDDAVIGSLQHEFDVTIIAPPGVPRNVGVEEVGATWVQVCWEAPFESEILSPISHYEIYARVVNASGFVNVTTFNSSTFFNVTGLLPGTTYELTVVAVSRGGNIIARSLVSEPSDSIMTRLTVPEPECAALTSTDGNITATWSYVHTGGVPLTDLYVSYMYTVGLATTVEVVSIREVTDVLVVVSNLVAGRSYTFNITAVNTEGPSTILCGPILHELGRPDVPVFRNLESGPGIGEVRFQIMTVASGVNSASQGFQFVITPILNTFKGTSMNYPFNEYVSGTFETITVSGLMQGETYTFSATAMNHFGESEPENSGAVVAGGPPPPPSGAPSASDNSGAVIGGVVGGFVVVILICVVVIVFVVVLLVYHRDRGKTYRPKKEEGDVRYQPAPTSDSTTQVKEVSVDIGEPMTKDAEIQYAELDTFRPPSQQQKNGGTQTEPKPVEPEEPVEYAIITNFKKKEGDPPPAIIETSAVPDPTPDITTSEGDADKTGTSTTLV